MSSAIISKSRSTRTSSIAGTPNSRCPEFYAVPATDAVGAIRSSARSFEESLPPAQRKRLGQFFTGLPLGALLAHLALDPVARTVIAPMAGHGDLLDAAALTAQARRSRITPLPGLALDSEPDAFCRPMRAALQAVEPDARRIAVPG